MQIQIRSGMKDQPVLSCLKVVSCQDRAVCAAILISYCCADSFVVVVIQSE